MKLLLGLLLLSPVATLSLEATSNEMSPVHQMMLLATSVVSVGTSNRDALMMQFADVIEKVRRQGPTNATSQFVTSLTNTIEQSLKPQVLASLATLQTQVNTTYAQGYASCDSKLRNDTGSTGPLLQAILQFMSWPQPFQLCKANESRLQSAYITSLGANASLAAIQASACSNFTLIDQLPNVNCAVHANENTSTWSLRMLNVYTAQRNLWVSAQQACIQATANAAIQNSSSRDAFTTWMQAQASCGLLQDSMDSTSCAVFTTSQTICNDYQGCYDRFTADFRNFIPGWQTSQQALAVQWGIFLQMECLMGTLTMANLATNSQVLANCTNSSLWTRIANSSVQLYYPPIPKTPQPCNLAVGYSGTAAYVRDQYSVLPANAPAKGCVSTCCATSTTTTTTIRVSSCAEASGVSRMFNFTDGTSHYCDMTTDGGGWTLIARVNKDYDWMAIPSEGNLFHASHIRTSVGLAAQTGTESGIVTDPAKIIAYKGTGSFELRFSFYDSEDGTVPVNDGIVLLSASAGANMFVRSATSWPRVDLSSSSFTFRRLSGTPRWTGNRLCWVPSRSGYEGGLFFGSGGDCHLANDNNEVQMKSHYSSGCTDASTCSGWYGGRHSLLTASALQVSHKKLAVWIRKKEAAPAPPPPPQTTTTTTTITIDTSFLSGSTILTSSDQQILFRLGLNSQKQWRLCYSKRRDGGDAFKFHSLCDGKGPSITVMSLPNGRKLGGHTPYSWASNDAYIGQGPSDSWLFSIFAGDNAGQGCKYPITTFNALSIHGGRSYGPTFGAGHDLHVRTDMNAASCGYNTYRFAEPGAPRCPSNSCSGDSITIVDLEVYVNP